MDNSTKMTSKEQDELCQKYEDSQKQLEKESQRKFSMTENSIENRANELKIKLQLIHCVFSVDKDGNEKQIWTSLEDINNEKRRFMLNHILTEAIGFWNGVPSNFLGDSPVNQNGEKDTT